MALLFGLPYSRGSSTRKSRREQATSLYDWFLDFFFATLDTDGELLQDHFKVVRRINVLFDFGGIVHIS